MTADTRGLAERLAAVAEWLACGRIPKDLPRHATIGDMADVVREAMDEIERLKRENASLEDTNETFAKVVNDMSANHRAELARLRQDEEVCWLYEAHSYPKGFQARWLPADPGNPYWTSDPNLAAKFKTAEEAEVAGRAKFGQGSILYNYPERGDWTANPPGKPTEHIFLGARLRQEQGEPVAWKEMHDALKRHDRAMMAYRAADQGREAITAGAELSDAQQFFRDLCRAPSREEPEK